MNAEAREEARLLLTAVVFHGLVLNTPAAIGDCPLAQAAVMAADSILAELEKPK